MNALTDTAQHRRSILNTPSGALRAPWRILLFIGLTIACILVAVGLEGALARMPGLGFLSDERSEIGVVVGLLAAHWITLRTVERKPWSFAGMGRAHASPLTLLNGAMIGAMAIGIPAVILIGASQLQAVPAADGSSLRAGAAAAAMLLPAAFGEELLVRGYIFSVIRESAGWKLALLFTSAVFGLFHMWNPGADALSILLVTLAGFFLGGVLLATGSLFAVTMTHFAWNWTMAGLLHTPVSGIPVATPDYRVIDAGPDWLTGGQWGPEGGVGAAAGMFVGFFYLYARRIRRLEF